MSSPKVYTDVNLDFEYELATGSGYTRPAAIGRLCHVWRHILRLMPGMEAAQPIESAPQSPGELSLVPWGVTPRVLELARTLAVTNTLPAAECVRRVNDKRFSHALEVELGAELPGSGVVSTVAELEQAARKSPGRWVAKHPFGVSGRERVLGASGVLDDRARRWAQRQFHEGWELVFEPWVEQGREHSLQFEICAAGEVEVAGWCELITDSVGTFRGHRVTSALPDQAEVPGMVETARRAMEAVAREGYFGPVGVDAMTGESAGRKACRPITEINARYTFGRLALELRHQMPPGWCYTWWHPARSLLQNALAHASGEPVTVGIGAAGVFRLPEFVDPGGQSQTLVLAAPSLSELKVLEARCGLEQGDQET